MRKKRVSIVLTLALSVMLLAGCQGKPRTLPADGNTDALPDAGSGAAAGCDLVEYGVAGEILSITDSADSDALGTIEVKGEPDNGATYDYATVTITPDTVIYQDDEINYEDLQTGMYVTVFFDGAVAESYPVQGRASQVNIVPDETAPEK